MVAPASLIPLLWLILWFAYFIFSKGILPREVVPFLFFATIAAIATVYSFFIYIPSFKGGNYIEEGFVGLMTLGIGSAFYLLTCSWLGTSSKKIINSLKLIDISGLLILSWTLAQGIYIFLFNGNYPIVFEKIQSLFSTRALFPNRLTGFAFEPSWLAQQLNLLYIPFWLAATITGFSASRIRVWKFSLENIFLVIGVIVVFVSSRIGTLSILAVLFILGIYAYIILNRRLDKRKKNPLIARLPPWQQKLFRNTISISAFIIFLGLFALGVLGLIYIISHFDFRVERFLLFDDLGQIKQISSNIYGLFNYFRFAERFVFWVAGWNIFNTHVLIGTGLGNAGFYFQKTLPAYSWSLPELLDIIYRSPILPNIKSLWIRLLAETGIVGFSSFITWLYVVAKSSLVLKRHNSRLNKTIGWFGLFIIISLIFEGFSTDTFALPYLWVSVGIVSACAFTARSLELEESVHMK